MRMILLILILLPPDAMAKAHPTDFHPVSTVRARTIQKGTLALTRSPLGNINTTFLASSLNFGLLPRLEIGTAPIFYTAPDHKRNWMAKLNFWRGDWVDWSLTYAESVFRTQIDNPGLTAERADFDHTAAQLALNIHPPSSPWGLGLFLSTTCGRIDSKDNLVKVYSTRCETENGVDVQRRISDTQWATLGVANLRDAGFSAYEKVHTGFGMGYTWFRSTKFLSRPSVGIYRTLPGQNLFLFSTTFFEK